MGELVWLALLACGPPRDVLQVKGSDTMVNLMVRLSEGYASDTSRPVIAVSGGGTGTGVAALVDGTTDFAAASREIKAREVATAESNGRSPTPTVIAYDGLAIYVNVDNPIAALSFEDLACIYGRDGGCERWSDLGVALSCQGSDEIVLVSRHNNSGTTEYFREMVLGKQGHFGATMSQSGTQQVVDVVGTVPCAIGFGGMGYQTPKTRLVCLSKGRGEACETPTRETVAAGRYPFSRPLFIYTDGEPTAARGDFLRWVLAPEGQKIVLDAGFVPVKM